MCYIPPILYHVNHVWLRLMFKICDSICEEVSEETLVLQGLLADGALPTPSHTQIATKQTIDSEATKQYWRIRKKKLCESKVHLEMFKKLSWFWGRDQIFIVPSLNQLEDQSSEHFNFLTLEPFKIVPQRVWNSRCDVPPTCFRTSKVASIKQPLFLMFFRWFCDGGVLRGSILVDNPNDENGRCSLVFSTGTSHCLVAKLKQTQPPHWTFLVPVEFQRLNSVYCAVMYLGNLCRWG